MSKPYRLLNDPKAVVLLNAAFEPLNRRVRDCVDPETAYEPAIIQMESTTNPDSDEKADAVHRMRQMLVDHKTTAKALRVTGTDNHAAESPKVAQRQAQRAGRETGPGRAKACDGQDSKSAKKKTPKSLRVADLGDDVRLAARVAEEGLEPPTRGL